MCFAANTSILLIRHQQQGCASQQQIDVLVTDGNISNLNSPSNDAELSPAVHVNLNEGFVADSVPDAPTFPPISQLNFLKSSSLKLTRK